MRTDAFVRKDFTYEVWNRHTRTDDSGTYFNYEYAEDGRAMVVTSGNSPTIVSNEPIRIGSQIRYLKDPQGNNITEWRGKSFILYVTHATPKVNLYGVVVAWEMKTSQNLPPDWASAIGEATI